MDEARLLAQLTLLMLRVAVPAAGMPANYIAIAPDPRLLTPDEAEAVLSRIRRPLKCTSVVVERTRFVNCGPLSDSEAEFKRNSADLLGEAIEIAAAHATVEYLLVQGVDEAQLVSVSAFHAWVRNYLIEGASIDIRAAVESDGTAANVVAELRPVIGE